MPEGPSIVILRELVEELHLEGAFTTNVIGNTGIDKDRMLNQQVVAFKSWGKHFLICFHGFTLRIHFLMFGSYRINERKESEARLGLIFKNDELNFYTCSLKFIEGDLDLVYDWKADVMSDKWDAKAAIKKLKEKGQSLVCDVLLDQNIFSGVGNIIKNEVLYRIRVHPLSTVDSLPPAKLKALIKEARQYSFDFLEWKKAFVLKQHWLINTKKVCPLGHPVEKQHLGKTNRRTFFCTRCQKLYEPKIDN
ncbi:endonuclease-8 [Pedobacter cryoconitis]|uniref:DNA-formamidopyrimidine glycosylase family protein n=1 Tax=Pedobacter cryoconitis TaxID=188932 RepID=UPI00161D678F|nr:DNA-formamidopyrimidine glycosylase family protein [Pedobacter cryoconitis]MBB6274013.1 endonuclease-8 [Pedobacter cryoconitis]